MEKLTIIIPVYNEASTIYELLQKVHAIQLNNGIKKQMIVVNDCSKDNSKTEIEKFINKTKNKEAIIFIDHKQLRHFEFLRQDPFWITIKT